MKVPPVLNPGGPDCGGRPVRRPPPTRPRPTPPDPAAVARRPRTNSSPQENAAQPKTLDGRGGRRSAVPPAGVPRPERPHPDRRRGPEVPGVAGRRAAREDRSTSTWAASSSPTAGRSSTATSCGCGTTEDGGTGASRRSSTRPSGHEHALRRAHPPPPRRRRAGRTASRKPSFLLGDERRPVRPHRGAVAGVHGRPHLVRPVPRPPVRHLDPRAVLRPRRLLRQNPAGRAPDQDADSSASS